MYKILIVDDEAVVRNGIRDNINWGEHGFEFIGACEDGSKAIEAVEELQPDVVLTDICMPFVDGIELTRYISGSFPRTKVIILTGYDEFEYAQQAVKLKAYDFLLKPITAEELRKILDKIKKDLDREAESMENLNRLKMQLRESLPLLKERFLNGIVIGSLTSEKILEKLEYFNLALQGNCYLTAVLDVDDMSELRAAHPGTEDELLLFAVANICEEIVGRKENGIAFQNNNNQTVIVLSDFDVDSLHEASIRISEEIRQSVVKYLKFTVTLGIGSICTELKDIHSSNKGALSALDYRFLLGGNHVISIDDLEGSSKANYFHNKEWELKLVAGVKTGSIPNIDETIGCYFKKLKASYMSMEKCLFQIQQILISVVDALNELGIDEKEVFGKGSTPMTEIYEFRTLDSLEKWLVELCRKAAAFVSGRRNDFCRIQALKAEEYIKENFKDENISLNSVCKHLLLSTSYFSMIFKSQTGETFIEYLTRIRLEKAMELLRGTNFKTYEIAAKVGYSDPHYFSLIFKKVKGMTPTEYREKT